MKALFRKLTVAIVAIVAVCAAGFFAGCELEDDSFTGIRFTGSNLFVEPSSTVEFAATYIKDDKVDNSSTVSYTIYTGNEIGSLSETSALSGKNVTLTVGTKSGYVGIKAECNGAEAYTTIGVKSASSALSKDDSPIGFAYSDIDMTKMTNKVVVTTPEELKAAASVSGNLVIVKGTIDMSKGILPKAGLIMDGSTATDALNAYVKANSDYSTYAEWIKNKTNCSSAVDYNNNSTRKNYSNSILIKPASNVAIIGEKDAVIRGGYIKIVNGVKNIVIRNLTIQDGVDPFPNHEKDDGWNAQVDAIGLDNGSNIWFDHLTIEDTLHCGKAGNGEKLQIYDGLLDMKEPSTFITVSHCIFRNHDKTMLIGTSDNKGDVNQRFITLAYNNFQNCGQRLPMVRNTRIHVMNCLYTNNGGDYSSQSSINARAGSLVWDDGNWFEGGATPSANGGTFVSADSIFDVAPVYPYINLSKDAVKAQAGAGFEIAY